MCPGPAREPRLDTYLKHGRRRDKVEQSATTYCETAGALARSCVLSVPYVIRDIRKTCCEFLVRRQSVKHGASVPNSPTLVFDL